jgi:thiamine-phosphate pyrophosphorylase
MKKLNGLYLVVDPAKDEESLLASLRQSLAGGVGLVQIWNHWAAAFSRQEKLRLVGKVQMIAQRYSVPVLINEDWELALDAGLDGVHFDGIPDNWKEIQLSLQGKLIGITVGNDLDLVRWADENRLSYISFCSVFPSSSVDTCELVDPASIRQARELTQIPIFLSGGIRPENLPRLQKYSCDGVAVISGILEAADPKHAAIDYLQAMKTKS